MNSAVRSSLHFILSLFVFVIFSIGAPSSVNADPKISIKLELQPTPVSEFAKGVLIVNATGVTAPTKLSISAGVHWSVNNRRYSNGTAYKTILIKSDGETRITLEKDLQVMISTPETGQTVDIFAFNPKGSWTAHEPLTVIPVGETRKATVVSLYTTATPDPVKTGGQVEFHLSYMVRAFQAMKFTIRQRVTFAEVSGNGVINSVTMEQQIPINIDIPGNDYQIPRTFTDGLIFNTKEEGEYIIMYELTSDGIGVVKGSVPVHVVGYPKRRARFAGQAIAKFPVIEPGYTEICTAKFKMIDGPDQVHVVYYGVVDGPKGFHFEMPQENDNIFPENDNEYHWEGSFKEEGTYTFTFHMSGDPSEMDDYEQKVSFEVKAKGTPSPTATASPSPSKSPNPTATVVAGNGTGTWGLIAKNIGHVPPGESNNQGSQFSGSIGEGSFTFAVTPERPDIKSQISASFTWDSPPAVLKPDQILELKCTASAAYNEPPGVAVGAEFETDGLLIMEGKKASMYYKGNDFTVDSPGIYKIKVPQGSSYDIKIIQDEDGWSWGSGGNFTPCEYVYRWNAPPLVQPAGTPDSSPTPTTTPSPTPEETKLVDPHWVNGNNDDECHLSAKMDVSSLKLFAGEVSETVHITLSGFRRNTNDRVDVIFPQATDGWASLPGQIVVSCGNGSYWPPIMDAPTHTDGFFFSARSTAPTGDTLIQIIVRQKGCGDVMLTLPVHVVGKPPCPPQTFAGTWKTNYGTLVLTQNGNTVTGTYDSPPGKITGEIFCDWLRFAWEQSDGRGTGKIQLIPASERFDGYWNRTQSPDAPPEGTWNGTLILPAIKM